MIQKVFEVGKKSLEEFIILKNLNFIQEEKIVDMLTRAYFILCKNNTKINDITFRFAIPTENIYEICGELTKSTKYIKIYPHTLEIVETYLNLIEPYAPNNKNNREELIKYIFTDILVLTTEYFIETNEDLFKFMENELNKKIDSTLKTVFINYNNIASS